MPVIIPVTTPVDEFTMAEIPLLLHTPPVVVLVSVKLSPAHITNVPVIGSTTGNGFTVIVLVRKQPAGDE